MKKSFLAFLILCWLPAAMAGAGEKPFVWSMARSGEEINLTLRVAGDNYIDAGFIRFSPENIKPYRAPVPVRSRDGSTEIFNSGIWVWQFRGEAPEKVSWQGCNASGICFLPEEMSFSGIAPDKKDAGREFQGYSVVRSAGGYMDKDDFIRFLSGGEERNPFGNAGFWGIILLTLLGGVTLNLTPCVLPMIPVNLAIIGASGGRKGFARGLFYGSGMAAAYGVLGILAVVTGLTFGTWSSSFLFNIIVALLFFILAMGTAGIFQIEFSRLFRINTSGLRGSGNVIAFLLGAVAALLAGACVAPVVISVLIFAAGKFNSGSLWAAALPLLLGIGMGLPWPFAGMGIALFPRPGKYMVWIKYIFALIIGAAGVYYLYTAMTLLPSAGGKFSTEAESFAALERGFAAAERSGKPLLVEFTASWCKNCTAMEKTTLRDSEVKKILAGKFVFVRFAAEKPDSPRTAKLLEAWNIRGFPSFAVIE